MSHKKMIWKEFQRAGILDSPDEKVQGFVRYLRECKEGCWEQIIPEFKGKYYDCFDTIVPVLARMNDPLIQLVLAQHADPGMPKERELLVKMAREADAEKNPVLLKRIAALKIASVTTELRKRSLPEKLRKYTERD
ncbi:MAG: hypothetical protein HY885_16440 [Deltaproteobacteria bacterium]|nr:hypothetical protein [Deltaproteobacteria bacterium]